MSNFLARLVERNAGATPVIQPLIRPVFAVRTRPGNHHMTERNHFEGETGEYQTAPLNTTQPEPEGTTGISRLLCAQFGIAKRPEPFGHGLPAPILSARNVRMNPEMSVLPQSDIEARKQAEDVRPVSLTSDVGTGREKSKHLGSRALRKGQQQSESAFEDQIFRVPYLVDRSKLPDRESIKTTKPLPVFWPDQEAPDLNTSVNAFIEDSLLQSTSQERLPVRRLLPLVKEPAMETSPKGLSGGGWASPGREGERRAFNEPPPPAIEVTIGRVDVQAVLPQKPSPPAPAHRRKEPSLSLDAYLKRRSEAKQ